MTPAIEYLVFNRLHYTKKTLPILYKHTTVPTVMLLMDNKSVDGSRKYVKKFDPAAHSSCLHRTRKVLHSRNIGIAPALNAGLKHLNEIGDIDIVTFTANDILFPKGWMEAVLEIFEKRPDIGLVGLDGPDHIKKGMTEDEVGKWKIMIGVNVAGPITVRKKILDAMGGWQGSRYRYGGVDGLTRQKVRKAGHLCCYIEGLEYVHLEIGDRERYMDYVLNKFRIQRHLGSDIDATKRAESKVKCDHWDMEDPDE